MNIDNFKEFISKLKESGVNEGTGSFVSAISYVNFYNLFHEVHNSGVVYFYLNKPVSKSKLLAWSPDKSITHSGLNRIISTESDIVKISEKLHTNWKEFTDVSFPIYCGGIKFSPVNNLSGDEVWQDFEDSEWLLASKMIYNFQGNYYVIFNFSLDNYSPHELSEQYTEFIKTLESYVNTSEKKLERNISIKPSGKNNDYNNWEKNVNRALDEIEKTNAEKIVLSRRVEYEMSEIPDIALLIEKLSNNYPGCHTFAFRKNKSVFFGASPERLASISEGWIEADALAGSNPRGTSEGEDIKLAKDLLESQKNINEQRAVVDFITGSFNNFTTEIIYSDVPAVKKLPNIQHLWTPIKAKLKNSSNVFSLLKEIHPTPAICGVPWSKALSFINEAEPHSRGLYAGIIGWFNHENEGEFIVALRSGLINKNKLYAFAGCGIVRGSDPKLEYKESELKLEPILSLFDHENKG